MIVLNMSKLHMKKRMINIYKYIITIKLAKNMIVDI